MILEILNRIIQCRSISPKDSGTIPAIIYELNKIGFISKTVSFPEGVGQVDNLYARLGTKGFNLCFAGHTDVVPPGPISEWQSDPFVCTIRDDNVYGRGIVDMKGAIAAFIIAVQRAIVREPDMLNVISISMMLTSDEEGIALNGIKKFLPWLVKKGEKISACFVGEPVSNKNVCDTIKIGARGSATFFLEMFGKQGHVAYHKHSENAITKLYKAMKLLFSYKLHDGDDLFQASNMEITNIIVDNEAENVIPGKAKLQYNVRYGSYHNADSLFAAYQEILSKHFNSSKDYQLTYRSSGDAFVCKSQNFVHVVNQAVKNVTDSYPIINTEGGTSDARFIHHHCPTLEIGLLGKTAHQTNECASLNDLEMLVKVYEEVIIGYYKNHLS